MSGNGAAPRLQDRLEFVNGAPETESDDFYLYHTTKDRSGAVEHKILGVSVVLEKGHASKLFEKLHSDREKGRDDPDVAHTIDMEAVNKHWDELPEREQRILVMRFYGNLTQTEIGERLGISQMHVSRLLARALGHLKSRLLDSAETETPHSAATA